MGVTLAFEGGKGLHKHGKRCKNCCDPNRDDASNQRIHMVSRAEVGSSRSRNTAQFASSLFVAVTLRDRTDLESEKFSR